MVFFDPHGKGPFDRARDFLVWAIIIVGLIIVGLFVTIGGVDIRQIIHPA